MRTEFINLFAEINANELENLTREIKETIATGMHVENTKPVFTAADLWKIHNMKRTRSPRRNNVS